MANCVAEFGKRWRSGFCRRNVVDISGFSTARIRCRFRWAAVDAAAAGATAGVPAGAAGVLAAGAVTAVAGGALSAKTIPVPNRVKSVRRIIDNRLIMMNLLLKDECVFKVLFQVNVQLERKRRLQYITVIPNVVS